MHDFGRCFFEAGGSTYPGVAMRLLELRYLDMQRGCLQVKGKRLFAVKCIKCMFPQEGSMISKALRNNSPHFKSTWKPEMRESSILRIHIALNHGSTPSPACRFHSSRVFGLFGCNGM